MVDRPRPRLLTFAPMIDSELSRLVLRYHAIEFDEQDHIFGWASLLTLLYGGYGRIPILMAGGPALSGSQAIAEHFDRISEPGRRLFPTDQPAMLRVEADFALFNGSLGGDVAALCYFHMLPQRSAMIELFGRPLPPAEKALVPALYPSLQWLFGTLLRLKAERMEDVVTRVRMVFDLVEERSARPFLVGDRLTMSDLSFAASAAPLIIPPGYTAPVPTFAMMPSALQNISAELQAHPAAARVRAVYELMPG